MKHLAFPLLLALAACSGGSSGSAPGIVLPHSPTQVLVMLADPDDARDVEELRDKVSGIGIERIGDTAFFVLTLPAGTDLAAVLKELGDDARVVVSEPDYLAESPEGGPSDIAVLGGDVVASVAPQPGLQPLGLPAAHALTTGAGVVVAVVDTGVDFAHPLLAGRLAPGGYDFVGRDFDPADERDFRDNDGDGVADEQYGHGTFVASLVLAVAPDARILPVRALDAEGFGTASTVAGGIVWAVDRGARVINVSVDIPEASEAVKAAIRYAEDRDVVVVAAAGNAAAPDAVFPARFSDVIGVGAVDAAGVAAPFTNAGSHVALVAPGVNLLGGYPRAANPTGTARWSGTSFSAPLVAGAAALVRSLYPGAAREDVRDRLESTALPVDPMNPALAGRLGRGLVQPAAALAP